MSLSRGLFDCRERRTLSLMLIKLSCHGTPAILTTVLLEDHVRPLHPLSVGHSVVVDFSKHMNDNWQWRAKFIIIIIINLELNARWSLSPLPLFCLHFNLSWAEWLSSWRPALHQSTTSSTHSLCGQSSMFSNSFIMRLAPHFSVCKLIIRHCLPLLYL